MDENKANWVKAPARLQCNSLTQWLNATRYPGGVVSLTKQQAIKNVIKTHLPEIKRAA